jgi:hypothetical protein
MFKIKFMSMSPMSCHHPVESALHDIGLLKKVSPFSPEKSSNPPESETYFWIE